MMIYISMVKKRTVRKSKKDNNSAYFEYKSILGSSNKFWRIVKDGNKITTHYGKIGTLGQMTTKDYGSKVDKKFESLIQSKKKKGYVESMDFGDKKPKPPTKIQREYMKICKKAENDIKLNPGRRNFDCEATLTTGPRLSPVTDSELKWFIEWHKDALKNKDYDWSNYDEHNKSKRKKKKTQKAGGKGLLTKLQIKNMQRLK
jgi:predicted DNA-binding WGR domain protein